LRREELATLAGVSVDYYVRLERGKEIHPSPSVVDALARALRMDRGEHDHLRDLAACAAGTMHRPSASPSRSVRPGIKLLLESLRPNPSYVISRTTDLLAWNASGLRLFPGMEKWPVGKRNIARYIFLHPAAPALFANWNEQIRAFVGSLRSLATTDPGLPGLARLTDELLLESPEFARLWEHFDVKSRGHGHGTFRHPDVGDLALSYQSLRVDGTQGHRLVTHYAEPGTPAHDAIVLLDMDAYQHTA
ncbi:helix-turn-helix transcriptional regulator, partial [Streptomyces sp. NPDC002920]